MKVVYKYGTGHEVPEGAIYLTTVVENAEPKYGQYPGAGKPAERLVWHYFLVDLDGAA